MEIRDWKSQDLVPGRLQLNDEQKHRYLLWEQKNEQFNWDLMKWKFELVKNGARED